MCRGRARQGEGSRAGMMHTVRNPDVMQCRDKVMVVVVVCVALSGRHEVDHCTRATLGTLSASPISSDKLDDPAPTSPPHSQQCTMRSRIANRTNWDRYKLWEDPYFT
jgi:hypothetical protein